MARTHLTTLQIRAPYNKEHTDAIKTKLDDFDDTLDGIQNTTDYKTSVRFATTANINLSTTALTAIDGVTPVAGDRALVKDQSTASQNGIYVAAATAWARATDCDASADVTSGMQVFVSEGTANAGNWYILTTADPIVLATDDLVFTEQPNAADLASAATGKGADLIGSYDTATIYTATTVRGQLQEVKVIADASAASAIQKRTVTVNDEDAGMTGASYVVNIGAALPANAIVVGHELNVVEQFTGEADTTLILGGTDTDGLMGSIDLDALGVGRTCGTLGVLPTGSYASQQLVATFAATALEDLSAGQVVITVWFFVLA